MIVLKQEGGYVVAMSSHKVFPSLTTVAAVLSSAVTASAAIKKAEVRPAAVFRTIETAHQATLLKARIGGQEGLFLFDTGGGVTIVTPKAADVAGCRPWGQMTGFRATGQRLDSPRCDNVRLTIDNQALLVPTASVYNINGLVDSKVTPTLSGLIALDIFVGKMITIRPLAHEIVLETPASLRTRVHYAREIPIRIVRDVEGLALTIDVAVPTAAGRAWMEIDTGNLGPVMVGRHVAKLVGLSPTEQGRQEIDFSLGGVASIQKPARVSDLIMDGDIGESVLSSWDLTLDLAANRAWLQLATPTATVER